MIKYVVDNNGIHWKKISRKEAKHIYNDSKALEVIPCKLLPFIDGKSITIWKECEKDTFENVTRNVRLIHCDKPGSTVNWNGTTLAYYIPVDYFTGEYYPEAYYTISF